MILKKLYEEYDLPIEKIILKEQKRLGLSLKESIVLLALFSIYKKRRTFSMIAIGKRVEYDSNDIGKAVESLQEKGFMDIQLEIKDEKEREVFDLDKTYIKIETLFIQDEKERMRQQASANISKTIERFEHGLGRPLMGFELDNIRSWYEENMYTHQAIMDAIVQSEQKLSVKFVERYLNKQAIKPIKIDQDIEKALDEIYKNIR